MTREPANPGPPQPQNGFFSRPNPPKKICTKGLAFRKGQHTMIPTFRDGLGVGPFGRRMNAEMSLKVVY